MKAFVRRAAWALMQVPVAMIFVLLMLLSPELALAWADRFMEVPMPTAQLSCTRPTAEALRAMRHFANTIATEEAFYLRFQTLPRASLTALKVYYDTPDPWWIFRQVCAFWRVGGAHRTGATRQLHTHRHQASLFEGLDDME
jgi:hypothetical protein